jgi:hypothetical protein
LRSKTDIKSTGGGSSASKDQEAGDLHRRQASKSSVAITDNRAGASTLQNEMDSLPGSERMVAQRQAISEAITGAGDAAPNNTGMPDQLKSGLEKMSGFDLSDVKVHFNSAKPSKVGALAYAQGNQIHVGPGQEKHLPHEGWHIVQQRQGRVKPTAKLAKDVYINDEKSLEREADRMGNIAMQPVQQKSAERDSSTKSDKNVCRKSNPVQFVLTRARRGQLDTIVDLEELVAYLRDQRDDRRDILSMQDLSQFLSEQARQWAQNNGLDQDEVETEALYALSIIDNQFQPSEDEEEETEEISELVLNEIWHDCPDGPELEPGDDYDPDVVLEDDLRNELFPPQQEQQHEQQQAPPQGQNQVVAMEVVGSSAMQQKSILQLARKPNTVSGPKSYTSSNHGALANIAYKTDGVGNINFDTPYHKPTGKPGFKANKANTTVELSKGVKKAGYMAMPSGNIIKIKGASRGQHFAVANRIKGYGDGHSSPNNYTWHHLTTRYQMVLVDRMVHSKHGHNGGVKLW